MLDTNFKTHIEVMTWIEPIQVPPKEGWVKASIDEQFKSCTVRQPRQLLVSARVLGTAGMK